MATELKRPMSIESDTKPKRARVTFRAKRPRVSHRASLIPMDISPSPRKRRYEGLGSEEENRPKVQPHQLYQNDNEQRRDVSMAPIPPSDFAPTRRKGKFARRAIGLPQTNNPFQQLEQSLKEINLQVGQPPGISPSILTPKASQPKTCNGASSARYQSPPKLSSRLDSHPTVPLEQLGIRQLRQLLSDLQISPDGCLEKVDLIDKIKKHAPTVARDKEIRKKSGRHQTHESTAIDRSTTLTEQAAPTHQLVTAEISRILSCSTPLAILGITARDSLDVAKVRAKKIFKLIHPDKVPADQKARAESAFHAVQAALALVPRKNSTCSKPPKPADLQFIQPSPSTLIVRWKMPGMDSSNRATSFRIHAGAIACYGSCCHSLCVPQGEVGAAASSEDGQLWEAALSSDSRVGNDELFRRRDFHVSITPINSAGEGNAGQLRVTIKAQPINGAIGVGLKRHNTFA